MDAAVGNRRAPTSAPRSWLVISGIWNAVRESEEESVSSGEACFDQGKKMKKQSDTRLGVQEILLNDGPGVPEGVVEEYGRVGRRLVQIKG